jgi:uncharacterized membrane protein (UPF0136 family)
MGRPKAFRVIATIMVLAGVAFGLLTAVGGILSEEEKIHGVHNTVVAALLVVLTAPPLIAAARSPERSARPLMHLAVVGVAGLATMALALMVDLFTLPVIVLVGVLWVLRPTRESPIPPGRVSPILLLLVLAVLGVASLALQGYASALDPGWAWAALAGSLVFVVVTEWERRRASASPGG